MRSVFGGKAKGARLERIHASPRWVDGAFRNVHPIPPGLKSGPMPAITEFFCGGKRRVPDGPLPTVDPLVAWSTASKVPRVTWLGHSTTVIEIGGLRVLTDPVWGKRASPFSAIGPKRFQEPIIALADLPKPDIVLISHDHYDHLDYPTIRKLARVDVPFVTSLGVGAHLEPWGIAPGRITELDWWESHELPGGVTITATPSQHFSGRGIGDRNSTAWSSFALRSTNHSVFYGADTGLTTEYHEIAKRIGNFDIVMLEVGAWNAAWGDIHLGPTYALEALAMLGGAPTFLPIHWGTFNLALHEWDEPAEHLFKNAALQGARMAMPRLGQAIVAGEDRPPEPWWRAVSASVEVTSNDAPMNADEAKILLD
jgi:L-ascorbate metabolism protein UlaG (beta-lactamase superfamily)